MDHECIFCAVGKRKSLQLRNEAVEIDIPEIDEHQRPGGVGGQQRGSRFVAVHQDAGPGRWRWLMGQILMKSFPLPG